MENKFEHKYPNENLHELDLTWIIDSITKLEAAYSTFLAANSITFADPVLWDITKQYSKNTIVLSPEGDAFLSKQPVASGIQLNNTDYWLEIFNFADYVRTANSNLTVHIEQNTTRATASYSVDDWLLWDDVLYKVTAAIAADDLLTVGTNIVHFTVEDFCRAWQTYMINTIAQYKADIDASELAYKNEINASIELYEQSLEGQIASTTASLQAQLNVAIAGATVDSEVINARVGYDLVTYATLGDAIRGQVELLANSAANDRTKDHNNIIYNGNIFPYLFFDWEVGSINASGVETSSTRRLRSKFIEVPEDSITYKFDPNDVYMMVYCYDSNYEFIERNSSTYVISSFEYTLPVNTKYVRFAMFKTSGGTEDLSLSDVAYFNCYAYPKQNEVKYLKAMKSFVPDGNLLYFFADFKNDTNNGITFTWSDNVCTADGTSTGTSDNPARNVLYSGSLPNEIKIGNKYRIEYESSDPNLFIKVQFFNSDGELVLARSIKPFVEVEIPSSIVRMVLRLEVTNEATLDNAILGNILFKNIEYHPINVRMATYNIGRYNYGYTPSEEHPIADADVIVGQMKEFFKSNQIDILALQEGQVSLDGTSVYVLIYRYLYPYRALFTGQSYPPSLYSIFNIIDSGYGTLTADDRPYVWALINIHGIDVFVMSVHLALTYGSRMSNYDELEEIVSEYPRFIILGDMNAGNGVDDWDAQPEYDYIKSKGWLTVNGGYWGQFSTYNGNSISDVRRLVSIFTSSNIVAKTYENPYNRANMPSDHRPLICDFTIY